MSRVLITQLQRGANEFSEMLQRPGFRPTRGHLEDARNLIRRAIAALEEQAKANDAYEERKKALIPGPTNRCSYCDVGPCKAGPNVIGIWPPAICRGGPKQ